MATFGVANPGFSSVFLRMQSIQGMQAQREGESYPGEKGYSMHGHPVHGWVQKTKKEPGMHGGMIQPLLCRRSSIRGPNNIVSAGWLESNSGAPVRFWPGRFAPYRGQVTRPVGEPQGSKVPHLATSSLSWDPGLRVGHPSAGGQAEVPAEYAGPSPQAGTPAEHTAAASRRRCRR